MVKDENMGTTLRVAGGWVRDKLVGQKQTSHQRKLSMVNKMDIDIALDNCMGGDFAAKLNSYMVKVWWSFFVFFFSCVFMCASVCVSVCACFCQVFLVLSSFFSC